jgi:hypothetical protein
MLGVWVVKKKKKKGRRRRKEDEEKVDTFIAGLSTIPHGLSRTEKTAYPLREGKGKERKQ